jgi:hypothetical protein
VWLVSAAVEVDSFLRNEHRASIGETEWRLRGRRGNGGCKADAELAGGEVSTAVAESSTTVAGTQPIVAETSAAVAEIQATVAEIAATVVETQATVVGTETTVAVLLRP